MRSVMAFYSYLLELKAFKEIKNKKGENKQCDDNEGF
jgi:hypothetical protein